MQPKGSGHGQDGQAEADTPEPIHSFWPISRNYADPVEKKKASAFAEAFFTVSTQCALEGTRTPNLLIRSQMLYPLSYERPAAAFAWP